MMLVDFSTFSSYGPQGLQTSYRQTILNPSTRQNRIKTPNRTPIDVDRTRITKTERIPRLKVICSQRCIGRYNQSWLKYGCIYAA